jgi:ribokinase
MKNTVTTIGSATRDIFLIPDEKEISIVENEKDLTRQKMLTFEYGAKIEANYFESHVGGTAINVAVGLRRQGIKSTILCAIGEDGYGRDILKTLREEKVNTALIKTFKTKDTDRSLIILDLRTKDRTIFVHKDAGDCLKLDANSIQTNCIYISSLKKNWRKIYKTAVELVKKENKRLFITPGITQVKAGIVKLKNFLAQVEVIFLNEDEAIEFTEDIRKGHYEIEENMRLIAKSGPRVVIVTAGEDGVYIYKREDEKEDQFLHVPPAKVKLKDITGAGDAFASGFLADYLKDSTLRMAANNGIKNSASVISHIGTLKGLRRKK